MSKKNPSPTKRAGDATGQSPDVEAVDREKAADLAIALKGVPFPATKEEILKHVSSSISGRYVNDLVVKLGRLPTGISYNSVSEVERVVGLVKEEKDANKK